MLHFYFQIPSKLRRAERTSPTQLKAYATERHQQKATEKEKNNSSIQPAPQKRSVLPFHPTQTTDLEHHTSFVESHLHSSLMTRRPWIKPQCQCPAKCKWCYNYDGEGLGGLIIKRWMNLTNHTLHTHAFGQKSIGFFVRLHFK